MLSTASRHLRGCAVLLAGAFLVLATNYSNSSALLWREEPDKVKGVNLGGWLVLEPWITPSLFEQFVGKPADEQAVDEWTFCEMLGPDEAARQLRQHWDTWVTEEDIASIAAAGLNHVRLPFGYWAFQKEASEPYVQGQLEYIQKALTWAEKYGLTVTLDLHGAPGSQNGFDNSGKRGSIDWPEPANVNRTIAILQQITTTLTMAPEFREVIHAIGVLNEPAGFGISRDIIVDFYQRSYQAIREINADIQIVFHDAFLPLDSWVTNSTIPTLTNVALDTHIYYVFNVDQLNMTLAEHISSVQQQGVTITNVTSAIPVYVGEWTLALTDCAKWLNGFGRGARYDGTYESGQPAVDPVHGCSLESNYTNWTPEYKQSLYQWGVAQKSAYSAGAGWIFWAFKTEDAPQWDYLLGRREGWMP